MLTLWPVTISQGRIEFRGFVSAGGRSALDIIEQAQREYVVKAYVSARPPKRDPRLTTKAANSLRRIGVLARSAGRGMPTHVGVLLPPQNWRWGTQSIIANIGYPFGTKGNYPLPILTPPIVPGIDLNRAIIVRFTYQDEEGTSEEVETPY